MDKRIEAFIMEQKNMTLCTSADNIPGCADCFYTNINESHYLVFKSKKNTGHITNALQNENVAGTIVPDISKSGTIKGIQFTGKLLVPTDELLEKVRKIYYLRYLFSLAIAGELWKVSLKFIKMTDNTLGFGEKLIWETKEKI